MLGERHDERAVVRRLQAGYRIRLPCTERIEPLDDRVVEAVPADARVWVRFTLERTDEITRRHLHVLERRRVEHTALEREGVRQAVGGDLGLPRREVGNEFGTALFRRLARVAHQRPDEAAAVVLPRHRVVGLVRVEPRSTSASSASSSVPPGSNSDPLRTPVASGCWTLRPSGPPAAATSISAGASIRPMSRLMVDPSRWHRHLV